MKSSFIRGLTSLSLVFRSAKILLPAGLGTTACSFLAAAGCASAAVEPAPTSLGLNESLISVEVGLTIAFLAAVISAWTDHRPAHVRNKLVGLALLGLVVGTWAAWRANSDASALQVTIDEQNNKIRELVALDVLSGGKKYRLIIDTESKEKVQQWEAVYARLFPCARASGMLTMKPTSNNRWKLFLGRSLSLAEVSAYRTFIDPLLGDSGPSIMEIDDEPSTNVLSKVKCAA